MVEEELERIEQILEQGLQLIEQGKLKQAAKLSKKLKRSWAVSEASRAQAILEGLALLTRRKPARAKDRCLGSICYLWDNPDGLFLIRQGNEAVGGKTRWHDIEIEGGYAALGCFTMFSEKHRCRFLVLADDDFEAMRYINEVANFQDYGAAKVLSSRKQGLASGGEYDRKGVYRCSPFTVDGELSPYLEQNIADEQSAQA